MTADAVLLLTGATGLVGDELFRRFMTTRPELRFVILTRHPERVGSQFHNARTWIVRADLTEPELGLRPLTSRQLQAQITEIFHCAANTRFDSALEEARTANTHGTAQLLEMARRCRRLEKFGYVSTVYVVGRCTGRFPETPICPDRGFVNNYQQSKFEAERLVIRAMAEIPAAIFRLSTIIGDAATGRVRQFNFIHLLLRLLPHANLLPMIPGEPLAQVDLITGEWAVAVLAHLFEFGFAPGQFYHVCAGPDASLTTRQLIDLTLETYASHHAGRKWQPITLPGQVDLATWARYVAHARGHADIIFRELLRVVGYFAAHLALFQTFENRRTLAGLTGTDLRLPPIRDSYERVIRYCLDTNWGRRTIATMPIPRFQAPVGAKP
jgi:nucleoside-diphosphate-sugar epimerase